MTSNSKVGTSRRLPFDILLMRFTSSHVVLSHLEATAAAFPVSFAIGKVTVIVMPVEIHCVTTSRTIRLIRIDVAVPGIINCVSKCLFPTFQTCHVFFLLTR